MQHCPCGTGKIYLHCCGKFISNQEIPATPEELMRSRYTAYQQADIDYIVQTMKSPAADNFDPKAAKEWAEKTIWTGLEVVQATQDAEQGSVEFFVSYSFDNKQQVLHEISTFSFENGRWYYIDGIQPRKKMTPALIEKIGRNDTCPCGSNKKYKKCCGNAS
jgi:SEC-C motif-containing protein